jgi:hypothetical protein
MEEQTENNPSVGFPFDKRLIWIADTSHSLSWVILAIGIIYSVIQLIQQFFIYASPSTWTGAGIVDSILYLLAQVDKLLYAGFAFLVLQAISEGIYLLMDIREAVQPGDGEHEADAENA